MRWLTRLLVLLVLSTPALADEGRYRLNGTSPGGGGAYTGEVEVQRRGEALYAAWVVGQQQYVGVGLLVADQLSFAIQDRQGQVFIAVYRRTATGWAGIWTTLGGTTVGTEIWEK
jgi:hypothetical protein